MPGSGTRTFLEPDEHAAPPTEIVVHADLTTLAEREAGRDPLPLAPPLAFREERKHERDRQGRAGQGSVPSHGGDVLVRRPSPSGTPAAPAATSTGRRSTISRGWRR